MLIEMLIAASCVSGPYKEACSKAMEASAKQTGIYQNVGKAEDMTQQKALNTVTNTTGEAPVAVVGFAAKTYRDKAITYKLRPRKFLPVDAITTQVGVQNGGQGSLNLEWRF